MRRILTGEVDNWQQLGFADEAIVAVVPSDPDLAERAARALIPGDSYASTCIKVKGEQHVADQLMQHPGAIGIVRVDARPRASSQRLLQIDWTDPSPEAFGYGTYPYGIPLQLVTSGQPRDHAALFLEFAQSPEGRELLGRSLCFTNR